MDLVTAIGAIFGIFLGALAVQGLAMMAKEICKRPRHEEYSAVSH